MIMIITYNMCNIYASGPHKLYDSIVGPKNHQKRQKYQIQTVTDGESTKVGKVQELHNVKQFKSIISADEYYYYCSRLSNIVINNDILTFGFYRS